jgi:CrcB protein
VITVLWIALGSALGGVARYGTGLFAAAQFGEGFPWGTLIVNVVGSFIIGLAAAATASDGPWPLAPDLRLFITVGFCGGFTTFSAFSIQTLQLIHSGQVGAAALNTIGSVVVCLIAVWAGFAAAAALR